MNYEQDDTLNEVDKNIELLNFSEDSEIKLQDIAYYVALGEVRLIELRNELQSEVDKYKDEYSSLVERINNFDFSNINNYKYACERYSKFLNNCEDINNHVRVSSLYNLYKKDLFELEILNNRKNELIDTFNIRVSEINEKYDFLVNKLYVYSMYGDLSITSLEPLNLNLVPF